MLSEADKQFFRKIRLAVDRYLESQAEDARAMNENAALMREWAPGAYQAGDLRAYNGVPYRCVQAHDSVHNPDWSPESAPALWAQYHGTSPETARDFRADGSNPYMRGEYCLWQGGIYRCLMDNAVWSPGDYPAAWQAERAK